jgi:hypothetical protein
MTTKQQKYFIYEIFSTNIYRNNNNNNKRYSTFFINKLRKENDSVKRQKLLADIQKANYVIYILF